MARIWHAGPACSQHLLALLAVTRTVISRGDETRTHGLLLPQQLGMHEASSWRPVPTASEAPQLAHLMPKNWALPPQPMIESTESNRALGRVRVLIISVGGGGALKTEVQEAMRPGPGHRPPTSPPEGQPTFA